MADILMLYPTAISEIATRISDGHATVVVGGRGFGKTCILRKLQTPGRVIEGRNPSHALSEMRRCRDTRERENLHVDDLDVLISSTASSDQRELLQCLNDLMPRPDDSEQQEIVATCTLNFTGEQFVNTIMSKTGVDYSFVLARFQPVALDPWAPGWEGRIATFVEATLSEISRDAQALVAKTIADVTVGHPALLGPVMDNLSEFARQSGGHCPEGVVRDLLGDGDEQQKASNLALLFEDILMRFSSARIRSAINRLNAQDPGLLENLKVLAGAEVFDAESSVRAALTEHGFVARPRSGQYVIPPFIRHTVLQSSRATPQTVTITRDPEHPEDKGEVVVRSASGVRVATLRGTPWRILLELAKRAGEFVAVEELRTLLNMESDRAAPNAVLRLRNELRAQGCGDIIENEWGKGYRLVSLSRG